MIWKFIIINLIFLLATVSIYGYDYLYRKIAEMGYENIYTGAGGDYLQAGNYPCFLYYFADLKLF